jgi:peptide/nickel transport system ATP-binding protein
MNATLAASSKVPVKNEIEISITNPLLSVNDLKVWFTQQTNIMGQPTQYFKAVDGVSFHINKGEILGLVGESGCGKSTISKALIGLVPINSGSVLFRNRDLATLSLPQWREERTHIQMVFQDPYSSLNPRMTIGDALKEPMLVHNIVSPGELDKETRRLIELVQMPATALTKYPHEFSGGQRQRIGIARALSLRPELLICDESVSALDVSIQAQILNLLQSLQIEFGLTYLFISHDLSVVHYISDRVMVMQSGKIVESGAASQVLKHPSNEYTKRLIAAMP